MEHRYRHNWLRIFSPATGTSRPSRRSSGLAHLQGHQVALQFRADHAGGSFEGNFLKRTGGAVRESCETTRAVAAHLGLAAVGIVIAHPEIGAVRRTLEEEDTIRADAAMPVADPRDLLAREREIARTIVEQDKIVARAIHFRETQHASFG